MKRVLCPKCDNYISFDETKYNEGQSLVFVCDKCQKQFRIRIGKSQLRDLRKDENLDVEIDQYNYGCVIVIENVFGYKQIISLQEGDNIIGKKSKGTDISCPIETSDPSMDRIHCIINVKKDKEGLLAYTLRDSSSITGTFYMNSILGDKDRVRMDDGGIITIGATTLILNMSKKIKKLDY